VENSPPAVQAFIRKLLSDPATQNRVVFPGFVSAQTVARINAGSDFLLLPSLYEPYGLSQLEAMKVGNIPIVHGVDGLRSTVSDPRMNRKTGERPEKVWTMGQNGILMKPLDVPGYWKVLDAQLKDRPLESAQQKTLAQVQRSFRTALEQGWTLSRDLEKSLKVRVNGLRYVTLEHRWDVIAPRYEAPIAAAIAQVQANRQTQAAS
jgi:glycogen synthase